MTIILKPLRLLNNFLTYVTFTIAMAIVAIMVSALGLSAVTRYISGTGYDWFIELPPVLISWLVFPLIGPLYKSKSHINVDLVKSFFSSKQLVIINAFANLIALFSAVIFFKAGLDATLMYFNLGQVMELEIEIPIWWMYAAFPTGFLIFGLFALELVLTDINRFILKSTIRI